MKFWGKIKLQWWQKVLVGLALIPLAGFMLCALAAVWCIFSDASIGAAFRVGDYLTGFFLLMMLELLIGGIIFEVREWREDH